MSLKSIKKWEKVIFDDIIDVRTPLEYLEDHIPSSINLPVLDNEERILIGKIYKKESPFKARKLGAALVSCNISKHLKQVLLDKPGNWKPLIYCWRGGQRSKSMATVFSEIGWQTTILKGGYKTYRSKLISKLNSLCKSLTFIVLKGKTGTAKTNLLDKLEKGRKLQVLNLERLANHKGSLLGDIPNLPQPSQKYFESLLYFKLKNMNKKKYIFIEGESSKIGKLFLPKELIRKITMSSCIEISSSIEQRASFLRKDYKEYIKQHEPFNKLFAHANKKLGYKIVNKWKILYKKKDWIALATSLINDYYDPLYQFKHTKNKNKILKAINLKNLSENTLKICSRELEKQFVDFL